MSRELRARTKVSTNGEYPSTVQLSSPTTDNLNDDKERKAQADPAVSAPLVSEGTDLYPWEWTRLAMIVGVALLVQLYKPLSWPAAIVFDEIHLGSFVRNYILRSYFVDTHPPLGKLLFTSVAYLRGYDGLFMWNEVGEKFSFDNVPYTAMRGLSSFFGVALVPTTYLILRALDCHPATALLGSSLVTFENGFITQSRLILLDSGLVFFMALSILGWVRFSNENVRSPFSRPWWVWLATTGFALGATVSYKWVGLFTIAVVGLSTVKQLWELLGDLDVSTGIWLRHFAARALFLIIQPIGIYVATFYIHLSILVEHGKHADLHSRPFQTTLRGQGMQDTFADVAFGSEITLRHVNTAGGYLHPLFAGYETASGQKVVTLHKEADTNYLWQFEPTGHELGHDHSTAPIIHITSGTHIRLKHVTSQTRLHSHDFRPLVSDIEHHSEASVYGGPGFIGDPNDDWIVEIRGGADSISRSRVRALDTTFRLKHRERGCYLFSHDVPVPYGSMQQEVTCNSDGGELADSLWQIEMNAHPQYTDADEKINYRRPGFFQKLFELHRVMWKRNASLTVEHPSESRPWSWLLLWKGVRYWGNKESANYRRIYLLGNPLVWWTSTAALFSFYVCRALLILRDKRHYNDRNKALVKKYEPLCGFLALGWALHYLPFVTMSRQLFLHHYFPALYFAILLACSIFDMATARLKSARRIQMATVLIAAVILTWYRLSPIAYGGKWTKEQCERSKWLPSWDYPCNYYRSSAGKATA